MSTPSVNGGTEPLAFTGIGPGTLILTIVGLGLTAFGWAAKLLGKRLET